MKRSLKMQYIFALYLNYSPVNLITVKLEVSLKFIYETFRILKLALLSS